MIRDEHVIASPLDFFLATPLAASGEELDPHSEAYAVATRSLFHMREPNMTEMLTMMKPLAQDAELPTSFFVDDL